MAYWVFLSHAAADRRLADDLKAEIERFDVSVYMFEYDNQPGTNLSAKLTSQIQVSDAVVVILSASGLSSPAVNQEIGVARAYGKLIVPLVERGVPNQRSTLLQGLEWLSFDRSDPDTIKRSVADYLERQRRAKSKTGLIAAAVIGGLLLWANAGQ